MKSKTNATDNKSQESRFRIPHVYVLLFFIMIAVVIASHIIPAGEFDRVQNEATGRMVIDPESFHHVEKNTLGIFDPFLAIPRGAVKGVDVIFMVVLTLAGMEIIVQTGALQAGIVRLIKLMEGKEYALIVGSIIVFGCIGGFVGWAEGILMFVPLAVTLARNMGFDALVGLGMTTIAAGAGFSTAPTNIYNVGVAQGILGLPLFSGIEFRLVTFVIILIPTTWYVLRYAKKVKNDPSKSAIAGVELSATIDITEVKEFTRRDALVILVLIGGFAASVYGCLKLGWFMKEIAAAFTMAGVIGGLIGGKKLDEIAVAYGKGAEKIIWSGLTIAIACGILVLMEDAKIIDTIIYFLANLVKLLPPAFTAIGMYIVQVMINTFIPSASGQAMTTVPILGPVAELAGSTQQVAVIAYQYGDGFTNQIIPTIAALWAALAMAGGIPYDKYFKWAAPLVGIWLGFALVFVTVANIMQLGPF